MNRGRGPHSGVGDGLPFVDEGDGVRAGWSHNGCSIGLSGDNYNNMMTIGRVPRCGEVLGFAQISSRGESEEPARQEVRASF